jgi:hypothetical protein
MGIMKQLLNGLNRRWKKAICGAALAAAGLAPAPAQQVGTFLFNGFDLSHWNAVLAKSGTPPKEQTFSVRDQMIVCKGEPLGFIETDKSFTNFKLEVQYRWAPGTKPGNSGIFLRINDQRRPLPRCIECQLKAGDAGDLYGFHGMKIDGDKARRTEKKGHELGGDFVGVKKRFANENKAGQWNRVEIEARNGTVQVKVNGALVNEATDCEVVAGPIGLQSEGGEIQFRKVRIVPLD